MLNFPIISKLFHIFHEDIKTENKIRPNIRLKNLPYAHYLRMKSLQFLITQYLPTKRQHTLDRKKFQVFQVSKVKR